MAKRNFDILFWIDMIPNKFGSFEQYLLHQARICKEHGLEIFAVFTEGMSSQILSLLESEGIDHASYSWELMHSPRIISYEIDRTNCKLVHFHFFSECSNLFWFARLKGVRILTSSRSSITEQEYNERPWWLVRFRRKLYFSVIDKTIAVSEFIGWYVQKKNGMSKRKVSAIPNGVDTDRYRPIDENEKQNIRRSLGIANDAVLVTYAGQIADYKGINDLLSAIDALRKTDIPFFFVFVGSGPLESRVTEVDPNILILRKRNDVNKILAASDIFVAPSVWYEAFGFTLAEASACGVPVVTTNVGGIPEIIQDGINGYVLPVRAPVEIASSINTLALDKDLRDEMGKKGRELIEKKFTVERMAMETYKVYGELLN